MTTITESEVLRFAERATFTKTASAVLNEERITASVHSHYDIFLSHSVRDANFVLGVKRLLVAQGKSVYVDWIDDRQLDRNQVTAATAETLRQRMGQCDSLFYLHSRHSTQSRWMPWELGYFDGLKGAVAILPVTGQAQTEFKGEEFIGLYPYVDTAVIQLGHPQELRIRSAQRNRDFRSWIANPRSFRKTI